MTHRLFARILLIAFSAVVPAPYRAHAQIRNYMAYMGAWSPGTAYNLNEIVLLDGVDYISLSANNVGNPPASSPANWIAFGPDAQISVKRFGAVGDGTADDTSALQRALTWMGSNGGCVYFPRGAYKTTAQLDWKDKYASPYNSLPLCLRGEGWRSSYIVYLGTATVDSAIFVANTPPTAQTFPSVDIRDIGIAANAHASYALHVIVAGPSTMDNVAFAGGSVSSFEGDGWNGIADLRNLTVGHFAPAGSSPCVNGLTFSHGTPAVTAVGFPTDVPSSQFTLTAPLVSDCTGIGLNLSSAMGITINGGQLSNNGQDLFRDNPLGQPQPVIFNGMLIEKWSLENAPPVLKGGYNIVNGVLFNSEDELDLYGAQNVIESSTGKFKVEAGSFNTQFVNDVIHTGSTDAGTGTYGSGNLQQAGGNAPAPWNGLPTLQVRYATVLPNGTDLYTVTACGVFSVANPVHGPAVLSAVENRVQVLCDQSGSAASRTLIVQGIYDPTGTNDNLTYINTESNGRWQGWQQFQLSGGLVTGYPNSPSGTCTVVGWMFSQDGHATFCNGANWVPKIE